MSVLDGFVSLFRGRGDAYGSWEGGCVKEPLTRELFESHLGHGPHIGVYPLIGNRCSWGCVDIDELNEPLAINVARALRFKGIESWIEKSANGYHVWVFPEEPLVPAAFMRRALMAACLAVGYKPKEVNPKQEELKGSQVGNYVRLPYHAEFTLDAPTERRMIGVEDINQFIEWANETRVPTEALEALSQLWTPPVPESFEIDLDAGSEIGELLNVLPGYVYVIWRDGPLDGSDRSNTLVRLAHYAAEAGFDKKQVFLIVRTADQRWGKFADRPDCEEQIMKIVEKVL